ncbi:MAG: DUF1592 domain-containing protein [Verrucomicrobiota bacterium]
MKINSLGIQLVLVSALIIAIGLALWRSMEGERLSYGLDVEPVLIERCYDCHGDGMDKGGIALDEYADELELVSDKKMWAAVYDNLEKHLMPPPDKSQPGSDERELVIAWIESEVFQLDAKHPDPGKVTIRRLNREEYNNTMRDLIGLDLRPADSFPEDDTGYGFDNIGDVLSLPPVLMERYLKASGDILNQAIVTEAAAPEVLLYNENEFKGRKGKPNKSGDLSSNGTVAVSLKVADSGKYQIAILAGGSPAKKQWPLMKVKLQNGPAKDFRVTTNRNNPQAFVIEAEMKSGEHWVEMTFSNDYYDPKAKDPRQRDRNLSVLRVKLTGPLNRPVPAPSEVQRKLFAAGEGKGSEPERAREVVRAFARRAFRRPVSEQDLKGLMGFYEMARQQGEGFEAGVRLVMQAVLMSPHFLFRGEIQPDPDNEKSIHEVDEYALASRLSYFLWSTMPDDELLNMAERGALRKNLDAQLDRMLADDKISALSRNFAGQWLQLRNLKIVSPDQKKFKQWDEALRAAMLGETEHFFASIVDENRNILEMLDTDYTFVNERLARHYRIPGVKGEAFRRVKLSEGLQRQRGGLLTQASILTITSNPTRTSLVKRGNWVLENILGSPPPPPPPDLPSLEESAKGDNKNKSLRQQLEIHREDTMCASCHNRMDPIGFGLESYNAIGAWQDEEGGKAIDASGVLYTGESFDGPAQMRRLLANGKKDAFVRCLSEMMLIYALGRGMEYYDKPALREITSKVEQGEYRMHELIKAVVRSTPFQQRRGDG